MPIDLYHHIYEGEIFQKSRCIWHENATNDFLHSTLLNLGFRPTDKVRKFWTGYDRTVLLCLVDDHSNYGTAGYGGFPDNTVILTDNYNFLPTNYKLIKLPDSFFGIYSYVPEHTQWRPSRRFNFAVNRIDNCRQTALFELMRRDNILVQDWVNFNCWEHGSSNETATDCRNNFTQHWNINNELYKKEYQEQYQTVLSLMPLRNHSMTLEQSTVSAWINLVMETYISFNSVAISEKTFRALVTPAPFMVCSGQGTIPYLRSLGFDTLDDLFDHGYDTAPEREDYLLVDKVRNFIDWAQLNHSRLLAQDFNQLQIRCANMALHNQQLLFSMRRRWPRDFSQWLPGVIDTLTN